MATALGWVATMSACGSSPAEVAIPKSAATPHDAGSSSVDIGVNETVNASDDAGSTEGVDPSGIPKSTTPVDASKPGYLRLLTEAQRILTVALQSDYQHATNIDEATGTFDFDCSGFLDYAMSGAVPDAFAQLQAATIARPLADSYVTFIQSVLPTGRWQRVTSAATLVGGDIVAWAEPMGLRATSGDTGHVLIVSGPLSLESGEVAIPVIDSATSGHGLTDKRTINNTTGIGEGVIAILVDSTGKPTGYRWSTESVSTPYTTDVVLAHLN